MKILFGWLVAILTVWVGMLASVFSNDVRSQLAISLDDIEIILTKWGILDSPIGFKLFFETHGGMIFWTAFSILSVILFMYSKHMHFKQESVIFEFRDKTNALKTQTALLQDQSESLKKYVMYIPPKDWLEVLGEHTALIYKPLKLIYSSQENDEGAYKGMIRLMLSYIISLAMKYNCVSTTRGVHYGSNIMFFSLTDDLKKADANFCDHLSTQKYVFRQGQYDNIKSYFGLLVLDQELSASSKNTEPTEKDKDIEPVILPIPFDPKEQSCLGKVLLPGAPKCFMKGSVELFCNKDSLFKEIPQIDDFTRTQIDGYWINGKGKLIESLVSYPIFFQPKNYSGGLIEQTVQFVLNIHSNKIDIFSSQDQALSFRYAVEPFLLVIAIALEKLTNQSGGTIFMIKGLVPLVPQS